MKYSYMTLPDDTEITFGDVQEDDSVMVYIETPDEKDGFHNVYCRLPQYQWSEINGYSSEEIAKYDRLLRNNAHLIIELARAGGFENAVAI